MKRTIITVLVLLFGVVTAADAQHRVKEGPVTPDSDLNWDLVTQQLIVGLGLPYEGAREQTLENAIVFATLFRDRMDLSVAVPHIRRLCEQDENAGLRALAFAALQAIGSREARAYLASHTTPDDARGTRQLIMSILEETVPSLRAMGTY